MTLGSRIKELLDLRGINQAELGRRIGMAEQDLSEIIKDKRNPTLKTLHRIAKGLGVFLSELFTEPEKEVSVCRLLEREVGEARMWEFLELVRRIKKPSG